MVTSVSPFYFVVDLAYRDRRLKTASSLAGLGKDEARGAGHGTGFGRFSVHARLETLAFCTTVCIRL